MRARPALERILVAAAATLLLLCSECTVRATDRFYSDFTVFSPDKHWRLEARSPDNAQKDRRVAFQKNFTCRLFDARTEKLMWERKQGKEECSPCWAWITNEAWVAIRTGSDELITIRPGGNESGIFKVLEDGLSAQEKRDYVHETTGGPRWRGRSHWYFLTVNDAPHFAIRTWWDKRIIYDLAKGRQVPDAEAVKQAADADETAFVLAALKAACDVLEKLGTKADEKWNEEPQDSVLGYAFTAAHIAGRMKVKEAAPFLRELQFSEYCGSCGGSWDDDLAEGEVNPFNRWDFGLRRTVQLALRRLGEKPADLPGMKFERYRKQGSADFVVVPQFKTPRSERIGSVKHGMTPLQVLEILNGPDALMDHGDEHGWDYEVDSAEPFTFRVVWEKRRVKATKEIRPPVWQGDERDRDLVY